MRNILRSITLNLLLMALAYPTALWAAGAKVPKPSGNLSFKIAETAHVSFSRLPAQVTRDRLNTKGWKIEVVKLRGTDLLVEAVSSGVVQFARFQILNALRSVQKGAKLSLLVEDRPGEFVMIARKEISQCDGLNGKRFAAHSRRSPYTVMSLKWMKDTCGAKPNMLFISGGENRVIALMNGQIDSTMVQLSDWINLNQQRPGEFPILMKFSEELPGLLGGVLVANRTWLAKNKDVATAYVAEILSTARGIASDSKPLEEAARKYQSKTEVKAFPLTYKTYKKDLGGFPQNGGLTSARIQASIDLFTELKLIKPGLTVDKVSNLNILEGALKIIGKASGKR